MEMFRQISISSLPSILALIALAAMPAMPASAMMNIELCNADGEARTISIPLKQKDGKQNKDCAKPCHACLNREKPNKKATKC